MKTSDLKCEACGKVIILGQKVVKIQIATGAIFSPVHSTKACLAIIEKLEQI